MLNLDESAAVQSPHEQIIDALRAELQEYGGLLNLFDQQQDAILHRKPDAIAEIDVTVEAQLATLRGRRTNRRPRSFRARGCSTSRCGGRKIRSPSIL